MLGGAAPSTLRKSMLAPPTALLSRTRSGNTWMISELNAWLQNRASSIGSRALNVRLKTLAMTSVSYSNHASRSRNGAPRRSQSSPSMPPQMNVGEHGESDVAPLLGPLDGERPHSRIVDRCSVEPDSGIAGTAQPSLELNRVPSRLRSRTLARPQRARPLTSHPEVIDCLQPEVVVASSRPTSNSRQPTGVRYTALTAI